MLPHLPPEDYLSLLKVSDVMLDPFHVSGVNTTYDALDHHKPIVTLPGRFQRGRFTYGCYRCMDVLDTVVESVDDYVERAVRLGCDADFRRAVEEKIVDGSERRSTPDAIARDMESCLTELIEQSRS